jgi:RIO kinase 1
MEYEAQYFKRSNGLLENEDEEESSEYPALESFFAEGLITEVLYMVKSGKEATVYCCRAGSSLGVPLVAAKVYRSRQNRNFKNDSMYREGRVILNGHDRRAVQKKTTFGREVGFGMWIFHEFEHLKALHKMGAATPVPYRMAESAILMEYMGDELQAAPVLNRVSLERSEAKPLFDFTMRNIELWLKHNLVHGDLSPFNILYWKGKLKVIDFPQAVDPRFNPHAYDLLERDITNVCRYFKHYGVEADPVRLTKNLWLKFQNSQL